MINLELVSFWQGILDLCGKNPVRAGTCTHWSEPNNGSSVHFGLSSQTPNFRSTKKSATDRKLQP